MSPVIDFSKVSDSFEPMPDGTYNCVLSEVGQRSSQKGNDYLVFAFTLTDEYEGRRVWRNFSLLPQSLWALKAALVSLGVGRDALTGSMNMEDLLEVCTSAVGNPCRVELTTSTFNGKVRNEVKRITN